MDRRSLLRLLSLGLACSSIRVLAQSTSQIPSIGVPLITAGPADLIMVNLRKGLNERGYVDGETIRIEHRSARGDVDRLPALARELNELGVSVFVAGAEPIARAIRQVTTTVPIVLVAWDYDPVASGHAESLNRPGGNVTGISTRTTETIGKRLELLKELRPTLSRVTVFYDRFGEGQMSVIGDGAIKLGLKLQRVDLSGAYDYAAAAKTAKSSGAQAVLVTFSPRFYVDRQRLIHEALAQKLPTMFQEYASVRDGGLISYGPDAEATWVRAGYFVDRLLKGAKASDLPLEEPRSYRLLVNLRTAKALGLQVPESILVRADEVVR